MADNSKMTNEEFEKKLWGAADKLRGNMDASEYKHIILGLIFLKYISDRFEFKYKELVDEGEGFENDLDEYVSEGIFFVPEVARWKHISDNAKSPEIGRVIDEAMVAIEKENKTLKGILPKNYSRPELDSRRLGEIVDEFTNLPTVDETKDLLGRAYEYCLSRFAEMEGKRGGEFYTPECVVKTIVEVLQPYKGRVYDPACGSGGMFVQSSNFIDEHQGNRNEISIYGQESNPTTWKMCKMNLAIRGLDCDLGSGNADTFTNDIHKSLKADYIMANPPFNMDWPRDVIADDIRWKYGVPPAANANYAWMQHMIHHMSDNGKIGLVLANGSLSTTASGEGDIRQKIIEDDLVECIIAMPTQLFYTTSIPVCIWFLSKNKKQKEKTLFIDAREMGTMETRKVRVLSEGDINDISAIVVNWQNGEDYNDIKGFCVEATLDDIRRNDYILTPGRYVGVADAEEDDEAFEEKMDRLTNELSKLFEDGDQLQEEVKVQLKGIGYDV